jgi:hypothetical protein
LRTRPEDHHHDVLGHADAVRVGDLGHRDAVGDRRVEVDVVRSDPRRQRELEVRRLVHPLLGEVGRPERLRDHHVGLGEPALELRVLAVLVGGHDQLVSLVLQEPP